MSENQRDPQYKLRWPEELRDKIQASAKEHNRSMNSDIVARLEQSFNADVMPKGEAAALIKQIQELLAERNRD